MDLVAYTIGLELPTGAQQELERVMGVLGRPMPARIARAKKGKKVA